MENKVILLVEDNPDDVELTLHAFRKSKVLNKVVVAQDGAEALDYLFGTGAYAGRDIHELPQVVLLDLRMPKIDGIEVLHRIRADERLKQLPVVVLTSSQGDKDRIESYQLGANSYLVKPVDFNGLVSAVEQLDLCLLVVNRKPGEECKSWGPPSFVERS
jgi:CheY-like chemotaxis protein